MTSRLPWHLHDALWEARRAREFLGELDADVYRGNVLVRSAVERRLEVLGEACKRVLDEEPDLRDVAPDLVLAFGLRNRLIRGCDRVVDTLWRRAIRTDCWPSTASGPRCSTEALH